MGYFVCSKCEARVPWSFSRFHPWNDRAQNHKTTQNHPEPTRSIPKPPGTTWNQPVCTLHRNLPEPRRNVTWARTSKRCWGRRFTQYSPIQSSPKLTWLQTARPKDAPLGRKWHAAKALAAPAQSQLAHLAQLAHLTSNKLFRGAVQSAAFLSSKPYPEKRPGPAELSSVWPYLSLPKLCSHSRSGAAEVLTGPSPYFRGLNSKNNCSKAQNDFQLSLAFGLVFARLGDLNWRWPESTVLSFCKSCTGCLCHSNPVQSASVWSPFFRAAGSNSSDIEKW